MRGFLCLILLLFSISNVFSQKTTEEKTRKKYLFVVQAENNTLSTEIRLTPQRTQIKYFLSGDTVSFFKNGIIQILKNKYTLLFHPNGYFIKINKIGNYSLDSLYSNYPIEKPLLTLSYAKRLAQELMEISKIEISKNELRYTSVNASIDRCGGPSSLQIYICSNGSSYPCDGNGMLNSIFNREITFFGYFYSYDKPSTSHYVNVTDMTGKSVYVADMQQNDSICQIKIDFSSFKYKYEKSFIVNFISRNPNSMMQNSTHISVLEGETYQQIANLLSSMKLKENDFFDELIKTKFFEEQKLHLDAIQTYKSAVKFNKNLPFLFIYEQDMYVRIGSIIYFKRNDIYVQQQVFSNAKPETYLKEIYLSR